MILNVLRRKNPYLCVVIIRSLKISSVLVNELDSGSEADVPELKLDSQTSIYGDRNIAQYMINSQSTHQFLSSHSSTPLHVAEVDQYLSAFENFSEVESAKLVSLANHLDSRLQYRTYVIGRSMTLADVAMWLLMRRIYDPSISSLKYPELSRWFLHIGALSGIEPHIDVE